MCVRERGAPGSPEFAAFASRRSCGALLVAASLLGASPTTLAAGDAVAPPVRVVRDLRIEYVRPVGLPSFEDPQRNLTTLEAAARDYLAAVGDDAAGALAPIEIRLLGANAVTAAAVTAPAGVTPPAPASLAPLSIRSSGATGAYANVLRAYATRARGLLTAAERPIEIAEALRRFAEALESGIDQRSELGAISVALVPVDGVLTAPGAAGAPAATAMTLPAVADFRGIDASAADALAAQVEAALERDLTIAGADGSAARLDFTVTLEPSRGANDETLRFRVAFVGPQSQPAVTVSGFTITYVDGQGAPIADPAALGLPDPKALVDGVSLRLYRKGAGAEAFLTDDGPDSAAVDYRPGSASGVERLSIAALRAVVEGVLSELRAKDLMGVFVDVAGGQFDMTRGGIDVRSGATDVALVVVPGLVDQVRVVASGERVGAAAVVNPPDRRYGRVLERSPFGSGSGQSRLLRQSELENYLDRQSRLPNRRVDAAVTPPTTTAPTAAVDSAVRPTIGLDYLVSESKPWSILVQGSNTGTGATGEWQQRFGVFHSDLFGNDEMLSIEYLTTDFDSMHAVNAYFDAPVLESERLRWKIYGGWYEYTASDVGLGTERFEGSSPSAGAELAINVFQSGKLFVDAVVGARWFNVSVNNLAIDLRGEQDFLVPYVGARLQRNTRTATTDASVFLDMCAADATDVDALELNALGRLFPERDWSLVRWDIAHSFYVDPLFNPNPSEATLAHEIALRFRGQTSFDARLIPQQLGVAGGLYTVRGYPESAVSGDRLFLVTGEYRLHIPQILGFDSNPQPFLGIGEPFRLRPQFGYGSTDWDLILRAFIDIGRVENVDRLSFERDETLIGAGVGLELQLWRNFDLRLDLGFPLKDLEGRELDDARLSFVGTLAF